jgi:hypothetical protein
MFFYRVGRFFIHWYVNSFWRVGGWLVGVLEKLDSFFAVRITARHFLVPLYQDYSFLGRILGIFSRSLRLIAGSAVYVLVGAVFLVIYLAWAAIPVLLFLDGIYS